MMEDYLTYSEVAERLRISKRTVKALARERAFPVTYLGPKSPRVRAGALELYLKRKTVSARR